MVRSRVQPASVPARLRKLIARTVHGARSPQVRANGSAAAGQPNLNELARRFGTDKWGRHFYTQHYARHLRHLRGQSFTLLEIGVGGYRRAGDGGRSLRMWKAYFPKAQIIGLDIEDKSFVDEERIKTYRGSQTDHAVLQRIVDEHGPIKVVIDDGSHRPEHIRATFAYLFPRLADNGVYAIEDTQTSYWPAWGGSETLSDPTTTISMVKDLVDGLHYEEFIDPTYRPSYVDCNLKAVHAYHNLVILEKGPNREGSNVRDSDRRTYEERKREERTAAPVADQRAPFSVPPVVPQDERSTSE
jgi:hypothetical protein